MAFGLQGYYTYCIYLYVQIFANDILPGLLVCWEKTSDHQLSTLHDGFVHREFWEKKTCIYTPKVEIIPSNGAGHGRATFLPGGDRAARAGFKQLVRSAQFEARSSTKVRIAPFVKLVSSVCCVWHAIRSHSLFSRLYIYYIYYSLDVAGNHNKA